MARQYVLCGGCHVAPCPCTVFLAQRREYVGLLKVMLLLGCVDPIRQRAWGRGLLDMLLHAPPTKCAWPRNTELRTVLHS
jgi:hypothetical protein